MPDEIDVHEPHLLDRPLTHCPECGSEHLTPVLDGEDVQFFCEDCGRCWHVELGYVHRVDPRTCSRCVFYDRCIEVYAADHGIRSPRAGGAGAPGPVYGHAARPHTADVVVEAWAPTRTACLEELVRGVVETFAQVDAAVSTRDVPLEVNAQVDEDLVVALLEDVLYLLDADGLVVADVELEEDEIDGSIEGVFRVVPVDRVVATGAAPKGVSRSDLSFHCEDSAWSARVMLDV